MLKHFYFSERKLLKCHLEHMKSMKSGKWEIGVNTACVGWELASIQGRFEKVLRLNLFSTSINFIEQQYCSISIGLFNVQAHALPLPSSNVFFALQPSSNVHFYYSCLCEQSTLSDYKLQSNVEHNANIWCLHWLLQCTRKALKFPLKCV